VKLVAELQPKYSTALFSDVGLQEDFSFSSVWVLLMPVDSSDGLPTHTCRRSGEAWTGNSKTLEEAGSHSTDKFPGAWENVSNLLLFDDTEVNWTYTYRFYQLLTNVHHGFPGFLGMCVCTSSWLPDCSLSSHVAWDEATNYPAFVNGEVWLAHVMYSTVAGNLTAL